MKSQGRKTGGQDVKDVVKWKNYRKQMSCIEEKFRSEG